MLVTVCTVLMQDSNCGIVVNRPTVRPQPVTDVDIFTVETKRFVEQPDRSERCCPVHSARPQQPIDWLSVGMITICHQVLSASIRIGQ